jgi:hypothetical protein
MPSNIVDLEEVVPGIAGMTFKLAGHEYHVPGDLPTDTTLELLGLFEELIAFEVESAEAMAKNPSTEVITKIREGLKKTNDMIEERLLAVFQIAQPDLEKLPFGSKSTNYVLGEIFAMVGIASKADPAGPLPAPPTQPKRPGSKTPPGPNGRSRRK